MNILKKLNTLSLELTDILDSLDVILDNTNNTELYNEIDNRVRAEVENALTNLDITINDMEDGMYQDEPEDEDDLDYEW